MQTTKFRLKVFKKLFFKDGDNGFNFLKFNESVIDPYGEEYDYGSVMHYSRTAFSYDGIHQTVVPFVSYEYDFP